MSIINKLASCRVLVYDWVIKTPSDQESEAKLSKTNRIDISSHVSSVSFSKSLSSPSGSFEVVLDNSQNWKSIIRRDTWCTIYMSNNEALPLNGVPDPKYSRAICYIERVAKNKTQQDDGTSDVAYTITGRDFGKVYEDTEIWQNYFKFEKTLANTLTTKLKLKNIETTDKLIELGHKLFFSSKSDLDGEATIAEIAQQWLLPETLLSDLGLTIRKGTKGNYFGNIEGLLNLSATNTTIPIANPLAAINGNAWARLKEWSVEPLNELFTELNEKGVPQLIYRPIPWGMNQKGYPSLSKNIRTFSRLAEDSRLTIKSDEITFEDIGEDSHTRYNHFFAWSSAMRVTQFDNISVLRGKKTATNREYPYVRNASILRHGFKPMHVELNTITHSTKAPEAGKVNNNMLMEYNEVLYDYWSPAIYFETGTVSIVGRNDIKIGKAIKFDKDSEDLANKIFYIEGYSDEFVVEEDGSQTWFQTLQLTRGVDSAKLTANVITEESLEQRNQEEDQGTFVED